MRAVKTPKQLVRAYGKLGSLRAIRRETGQTWHSIKTLYDIAVADGLIEPLTRAGKKSRDQAKRLSSKDVTGRVKARKAKDLGRGKRGVVRRYIFTSAQNNTYVHEQFWENLGVLAKHYRAEIHVSRFTYSKQGLGAAGDKARVVNKKDVMGDKGMWWDTRLETHLSDKPLKIAKDLIWCGEMNILPTANRPLNGFDSFTGPASGIFPHVKLSLESVPTRKDDPAKMNYTTGACTLRNYIQRKAGLKAGFHHCYAALLVEVDTDGEWFVRQLNADSEGTICDLDVKVYMGRVKTTERVLALNWGDLHVWQIDPDAQEAAFGLIDGMLDSLQPQYQFAHDTLDFKIRNHHDRDYHSRLRVFKRGGTVQQEIEHTFQFLDGIHRDWCKTVVVAANHDDAATRWLREADFRSDPENALFYLECQTAMTKAILAGDRDFSLMRYFHERFGTTPAHMLLEDESFTLRNIEFGMHGHLGPNGARGNIRGFSRMGWKANIGHSHSAGIHDGLYQAGTTTLLDLGYNRGPSSWSHSHIVTYSNGKRAIITSRGKRWRAANDGLRQRAA